MKKKIYKFICDFWTFIRTHEIPTQNDDLAWDKVVDDIYELTAKHQTGDPMDRLFRMWVVAYLEYMRDVSKGIPTVMQEAREAERGIA